MVTCVTDLEKNKARKRIGIIGGLGKMGAFFHNVLIPYASEIFIVDKATELRAKDLVDLCEVIVIAVPIRAVEDVVAEMVPWMKEQQLLVDLSSLKERACQAMLKGASAVIGLHPLFAPSVKTLRAQKIVACLVRPRQWEGWLKDIFKQQGAEWIELEPKRHDQIMAKVQAMTHFLSLVFARTIQDKGIKLSELLNLATPVFRLQIYLVARVLSQSSALYADIEMENPYFPEQLKDLETEFKELQKIVEERDKSGFDLCFEQLRAYFSDVMPEAIERTTKMLALVESESKGV